MFIRQCDYCHRPCDKNYYYITAKPSNKESHMCRFCWRKRAMGKGLKRNYMIAAFS